MTVVTFSGITLENPTPQKITETPDYFECEFECATSDLTFTAYNALKALCGVETTGTVLLSKKCSVYSLGGTSATLVIAGVSYTKCYIANKMTKNEVEGTGGTQWTYKVRFLQDTTT